MHQNCWRWGSLHTIDEIHDTTQNHRTRCLHFSPKCNKIVGGWGSAPDPAGGAYTYHWWNPWPITQNHCTKCFHLCLKCTNIVGGWGFAPDPAGGAYSSPPGPLAVKGWDEDLVTILVGVDFDMCPLACDQCPLALLKLATGLTIVISKTVEELVCGQLIGYLKFSFPIDVSSASLKRNGVSTSHLIGAVDGLGSMYYVMLPTVNFTILLPNKLRIVFAINGAGLKETWIRTFLVGRL